MAILIAFAVSLVSSHNSTICIQRRGVTPNRFHHVTLRLAILASADETVRIVFLYDVGKKMVVSPKHDDDLA